MNNIQCISDLYLCSNCGACFVICPRDSIEFKRTSMGRYYANVKDDCVNCGLCSKVCPSNGISIEADPYVGNVRSVYVGKSTNNKIYQEGQSGGMATGILNHLFDEAKIDAAVVTKMSEGSSPKVYGMIVSSPEELGDSQKSCYTPVDLLSVLKESSHFKSIALVGLPCHIEGLKLLQRVNNRFSNVKFLVGLICDRTLCEGIQDVVLSFCKESPLKIDWRRKDFTFNGEYYPYSSAPVVVFNSKGYTKVFPKYYRISLKEMFTSPRCRVCRNKLNIYADIVLGDPWGVNGVDMKHGMSLILTRTENGDSIIQEMINKGTATLSERNLHEVLEGQHIDERRKSVSEFHAALEKIYFEKEKSNIDLLTTFPNKSSEKAYLLLKRFIQNEQRDKESIVSLGRKVLRKENYLCFFRKSRISRIVKRLESLIRSIKR